jgi:hypothetical protein
MVRPANSPPASAHNAAVTIHRPTGLLCAGAVVVRRAGCASLRGARCGFFLVGQVPGLGSVFAQPDQAPGWDDSVSTTVAVTLRFGQASLGVAIRRA